MGNRLKLSDKKRLLAIVASLALVIITAILVRTWISRHNAGFKIQAPDFATLEPASQNPEWRKSQPTGNNDSEVYVYSDSIDGVKINVSQQALPASFRDDPASKVANLANGFNASKTMQVNGMQVYIGTSAKGPQSVIFSDGNILVLIKSTDTITDGSWADYIKELQ